MLYKTDRMGVKIHREGANIIFALLLILVVICMSAFLFVRPITILRAAVDTRGNLYVGVPFRAADNDTVGADGGVVCRVYAGA